MGWRITSSPTSPTISLPSGSNAVTSTPRHGPDSSPRYTGSHGLPATKPEQTSVPPLIELTRTRSPNCSSAQSNPSLGSGEPVMPSVRRWDRSTARAGSIPAARQDIRYAGLVPSSVTRASAAIRHCCRRSGKSGLPSTTTMAARRSSADIQMFHIAHAVVVNHSEQSPGRTSRWKACVLKCSSRIPPWPCTMAFGSPVVPEEKSTYSGWSKGTRSNATGAGSARSSDHGSASLTS